MRSWREFWILDLDCAISIHLAFLTLFTRLPASTHCVATQTWLHLAQQSDPTSPAFMEWHVTDAHSLRVIDSEIGDHSFSPSEYEIVRRVIYATADFDFKDHIHFSEQALQSGAAALAARTTIIVDVPMVQVGITPSIQNTFANPVYCSMDALTRPQKGKSQASWGIETLAQRYPEGIFVVGASEAALATLVDLIDSEKVRPALVVATPAGFIDTAVVKDRLQDTMVPHVRINGRKGSAVVAAAIVNGLVDLAWQAYGKENA